MSRYRWVRHEDTKLYEVGILDDGTLHNPNGYPADVVRAAVLAADERGKQRRSNRAKLAAQTRRVRQERRVYEIAQLLLATHSVGPRNSCRVCLRGLDDQQSIDRGIGPECWEAVLEQITKLRSAA